MSSSLRTPIFVNQAWLSDLFSQTVSADSSLTFDSLGAKVRTGIVDLEAKVKRGPNTFGWSEMLDAVVENLRGSGQLIALRPETLSEYHETSAQFVFEFTAATRVLMPIAQNLRVAGLPDELAVWIADPPDRRGAPESEWDFSGSYLILVENGDHAIDPPRRYVISGISALAAAVRMSRSDLDREVRHSLGRTSAAHPVDKLKELGGSVSLERNIQTLYQMRYMTDEQGGWAVSDGRVHDLLGYPVAIAAD